MTPASLRVPCLVLLVLTLAGGAHAGAADLSVVAVDPPRWSLDATSTAVITVTFSDALDADTVPGTLSVFGRWSGVVPGTTTLVDGDTALRFVPERALSPGEQVTVSVTRDLQSTGGAALPAGHAWQYMVRPAPAPLSWVLADELSTRFPGEGQVQSYGIYAGDLDGDGAPDLSIPNEQSGDVRVFRNDGCGSYGPMIDYEVGVGTAPSANEGHDMDGDGDIDFVVANTQGESVSLLRGDGAGNYGIAETDEVGDNPRGLTVLDLEGDGDVDALVACRGSSYLRLLTNDGTGALTPGQPFNGGGQGETAVIATDANGDGLWDLYVGNYGSDTVACLLGDGTGDFSLAGRLPVGQRPWMVVAGDLDGDGVPDPATADSGDGTLSVRFGVGDGDLTGGPTLDVGDFPIAVDMGDLDGDGDLDLVGSAFHGPTWTVYANVAPGILLFAAALPAPISGSCASLVDDDRDGRLDLLGLDETADVVRLWRPVEVALPDVQPRSCEATLRLGNQARSAGFGGSPPSLAPEGSRAVLGLSGTPGQAWLLAFGNAMPIGLSTPFGLQGLAGPQFVLGGLLDVHGEALLPFDVPTGLPPGLTFALQGVVQQGPMAHFTNPEGVIVP